MSDQTEFLRRQARTQRFTLGAPRDVRVAPDGSRVLFLRSSSGESAQQLLWRFDPATGTESVLADPAELLGGGGEELSAEERARRERAREQRAGIVGNATDKAVRLAAFALSGRLFVADAQTGEARELPAVAPVVDPRPDPTGRHVAYLSGPALRVVGADGADDRALAEPAGPDRSCGAAEFVAAEEMQRSRGYWWSPDGSRLLVAHVDETGVDQWYIADPAQPASKPAVVRYPGAGTANAVVTLTVTGLDGTEVEVDWDNTALPYLVTAHWSAGGPPLIAVQSRDQRTIRVLSVDPDTGSTAVLHEETDDTWLEVVPGVPAWTTDGRLVTVAVRDDAYRLLVDGEPATGPDLQVRSVLDVGDDVLVTASADDPTQVHVYRVDTAGATALSTVDGLHSAARGGAVTVLASSTMEHTGPRLSVLRDGVAVGEITSLVAEAPLVPSVHRLTLGERGLRAALLFPTGHQPGSGRLPVLLDPYGGPHAQRVLTARGAFLHPQWLADQGFAVLVVDGRGTQGRGAAWERSIAGDPAEITLTDQIDALHAAAAQFGDLDLTRVGMRGWSYGGYLSALAVLRRPDVIHAAIAGAPVTDWRLYDTHYTERYLGDPNTDPDAYERNSLISDAPKLERPLLIIHGLADDNVVVAHSVRLSAALVAAGRKHTFLPLPGVTHMTPHEEDVAVNFAMMQLSWLAEALGAELTS